MLEALEWSLLAVLEVPDEDSSVGGSGQPLVGWVELQVVDLRFGLVNDRWLFEVVDVPDFDLVIFTAGGNVFTGWGNGEGIDGFIMSSEGVFDLEVLVPDLEISIPSSSSEVLHFVRWGVSDTGDPVLMVVLLNGVFALTFDIPKFDVLLAATREDNSVVWVEAARKDFFLMTDEFVGNFTFSEVPKSKGTIPRSGKGKLVLARKLEIIDEMIVTTELLLWLTEDLITFLGVEVKSPNDDALITRAGDEHSGVFFIFFGVSGNDTGDPSSVAHKESSVNECNVWSVVFHIIRIF